MKKEDIMKILPKEAEILKKIDESYDKVLIRDTRHEGLEELEGLRGRDSAVQCIIGHTHEMEFYEGDHRDASEAKKAIAEYERVISQGGYEFLRKDIQRIKQDAGI